MTVYVDDMYQYPVGRFHGMKMSHLIADTDEELFAMVDKIGVQRKWWQRPPRHDSHFDIALGKRAAAVREGAVEITMRQCSFMCMRRRKTGSLGKPGEAESWVEGGAHGQPAPVPGRRDAPPTGTQS